MGSMKKKIKKIKIELIIFTMILLVLKPVKMLTLEKKKFKHVKIRKKIVQRS